MIMEKKDTTWDEVIEYLPLIEKMAKTYSGELLDYDDLVQEACFVVLENLPKYDSSRGASITTYLCNMIRYHYFDLLTSAQFSYSVPIVTSRNAYRLHRLNQETKVSIGDYLTDSEKSKKLKMSLSTIKVLDQLNRTMRRSRMVSLEKFIYENEEPMIQLDSENNFSERFIDFIPGEDNVEEAVINSITMKEIFDSMDRLTQKQKEIILYRLGFVTGKAETLESTAKVFGGSLNNIHQQYKRGVKKLKKSLLDE